MSRFWDEYIMKRFKAQKNLVQILRYQGIEVGGWFDPPTSQEFRKSWREKIDPGNRVGVLELDALPQPIVLPDGHVIMVIFVPSDLKKLKIPKATVRSQLLHFLQHTTGMTGEQAFNQIEVIKGIEAILISYTPLDGSAKNEIEEFNSILEYPIRHFTVAELQFDPTKHKTQPKIRVLSEPEVQALIDRQKGLIIGGRNRLVPEFERRLEQITDESKRIDFIRETNEEILSKLQTMNSTDPWVKWHGFKIGDVLEIRRRTGNTPITYRRVVLVEPTPVKPPTVTKVTTNK